MKRFLFLFILICFVNAAFANHIKGGWIQYEYLGPGATANTSKYQITVRQYLDCGSTGGQRDASVFLGIFDGATSTLISTITILRTGTDNLNKTTYSPCLSTPLPPVCYIIDIYSTTIDLPTNVAGYQLSVQRCCRINGIVNTSGNSNNIGVSYTNKIPGIISGINYSTNKSPVFAQKDTAIICINTPFTFDFSASDADGDLITYTFCDGLTGGDNSQAGAQPNPPSNPPYQAVPYGVSFSGISPMGALVNIDSKTGIISGIAPSITGDYIVSVCANEFRNGILIGTTKKEIHIKVADCSISAATLKPTYITCNGTTLSFQNESTSSNITSYAWDFGVTNLTTDTSSSPTPTYDFLKSGKDSGVYTVKLKVSSAAGCLDSTSAEVKVYPGFSPNITINGTCFLNTYQFKDATTTKYGFLNSWKWDFGDSTTLADTATRKDSAWKYQTPRSTKVSLIVSNSKGCIDTVTRVLNILDKPSLNLGFRDTLICSNDSLLLKANISSGTVLWTPQNGPNRARIVNTTSVSPLVFPRDTTKYIVTVNDNGCFNTDSVTVNVLQFISVKAGLDTGICRTDSFRLRPISDAVGYLWTSSTGERVSAEKNPFVKPLVNTRYYVLVNLGKCQARDSVFTKVSPLPTASLGSDVTVCFGSRIQLNGNVTGTFFSWSPTNTLINENTLSPIAGPSKTTTYVLTVSDTAACLKAVTDTILVSVIQPVIANAGKDTSALPNQPLQMNATGGTNYFWSPATGLNDPNISNPITTLDGTIDSVTYNVRVTSGNCTSNDQVVVRVFKNGPEILVPSAFTPNGDGKNDVIRPITQGIVKLNFFSIYNRFGQLLYTVNEVGKGWDGVFNGVNQPSGTYVYQTEGTDYLGNKIFRKGTVVLIR